ncbi:protein SCAR3-like [Triticum dicoccoides]|uniref:protein SCAR3-like n=2 Tax=Triticum dicoccoides TaxID=85692 RepID=UPI00188F9773|nr:protein SCAR3-like [Triticum dicoccoides]
MAGFVGLLRQLGDLTQLAAEVFQGLHDQATAVSARAGGLALGAGRLEAELPLLEERLRRRRNRRPCFVQHNVAIASEVPCRVAGHGVDRPVILVGGTRPCSIEEHIQRCRRPPQLSILEKYDAGGEGACLKRYTDPSFFRAHSAQHESDLQSSDNHSKPPAKEAHHNKYSKFKTGALSDMLQQLKYRHMIRIKRRQKHNFQNQGSSQDEASEARVLSSADSPETSNSEAPCPAVPANKERSSDLAERTSSFGAWLSPSAACCIDACENTPDNTDGSASHGANKADENANNATNSRSALVDFIASRVQSSPRKLSVKKHSDPLTESFRNMAKKLLLEYESAENFRNSNLVAF